MKQILCLIMCWFISVISYPQRINWEQPVQSGSLESSVCVDSKNMLYVAGSYSWYTGENYFNNYQLPIADYNTRYTFIVKSDTNYQIKWIKSIKSTGVFFSPVIKNDNSDCLILLGIYTHSFQIDSLNVTEIDNDKHAFIGKFDSDGKLLWYNSMHGDAFYLQFNDLTFDQQNNMYLVGNYRDKVVFFNKTNRDSISSKSLVTSFIAKYNSEGRLIWTHSLNNSDQLNIESIDVDKKRNIYATGWCFGKYYFNHDSIDAYNSDIFIIKYDSLRNVSWYKQLGIKINTIHEAGKSVRLDNKEENIYVTGSVINSNDKNIFLAKYSSNGNQKWIRYSGNWSGVASTVESGKKIFVDKNDFVYLTGDFLGAGLFGDTTIYAYDNTSNSNLYEDIFVAKYYANGDLLWVTHAGHEDEKDYVSSLTKDNFNNIFFAGYTYRSGAKFGEFTLNTKWNGAFLSKIKDKVVTNKFEANSVPNPFIFINPQDNQIIVYKDGRVLIEYSPFDSIDYDGQQINDIIRIKQNSSPGLDTLIITSGKGIISIDSIYFMTDSQYFIEGKRTDGIDTIMASNIIHFRTPKLTTDIDQGVFESLSLYPIPFTDYFILKHGISGSLRISLYNFNGMKLLDSSFSDDLIRVSTADFLPGIYFLKVSSNNYTRIFKMIKK